MSQINLANGMEATSWLERSAHRNPLLWTTCFVISLFTLWQAIVFFFRIPEYLLPSPFAIGKEIGKNYSLLLKHAAITLVEIILGFLLGAILGIFLAAAVVHSYLIERFVLPIAVFFQTIPKLAIAPLFLVWLGYGILPKVIVVVLMSIFPVLINTVTGLRSVDSRMLDLMNSLRANRFQIFWKIRLPASLPNLFAGLRIAITLSVIGAIVAEWVGSSGGLGFLILSANSQLDTVLVFAILVTLSTIGLMLFGIIYAVEKSVLHWQESIDTTGAL